ncbi:hypothetical protein CVV77_03765 [Bacillus sp. SN1]|nr:hypothetical protein CVV77_03765 [Bacillus sp. SN1]
MKKRKKKSNKNAQERSERFCRQMVGSRLKRGKGGVLKRK